MRWLPCASLGLPHEVLRAQAEMKTPATQVFSARMTDLLLPILGDDWALYRRYSNSAQLDLTDKIQPGAFELRKDGARPKEVRGLDSEIPRP